MAVFYTSNENQSTSKPSGDSPSMNINEQQLTVSTPSQPKEAPMLSIVKKAAIPDVHKRVADSYMLVRQIFGTPVIHSKLTEAEKALLCRFDFYPLEYTTARQIEKEIELLKTKCVDKNIETRTTANQLMDIRAKELKHIIATNYVNVKRDVYDGYKALDKYFHDISKYKGNK